MVSVIERFHCITILHGCIYRRNVLGCHIFPVRTSIHCTHVIVVKVCCRIDTRIQKHCECADIFTQIVNEGKQFPSSSYCMVSLSIYIVNHTLPSIYMENAHVHVAVVYVTKLVNLLPAIF